MNQLRVVVSVNLPGLPAVALPVGVANGLPMGVQVIGDRFREDLALDGAAAIERALGRSRRSIRRRSGRGERQRE